MTWIHRLSTFLHESILALILVALLIFAGLIDHQGFTSASNQQSQFFNIWNAALLAIPMTLIIISGGIDLSVGSTTALAAVSLGMLFDAGFNIHLAAAAALLTGAACGFINGFFITRLKVHPLIVTLATFSAYRGLAEGLSLGLSQSLHLHSVYNNFPENFQNWGRHAFFAGTDPRNPPLFAFSAAGWLFLALALASSILLAKTAFGRTLYAIGHNEPAARYSGLRVNRAKLLIYTFSGAVAGLAAINYAAFNNNAQAGIENGIELVVITAVVLGGTSIFGGRGRIIGTVLGVALIHETREFVSYHYNQDELVNLILGALLLIAVAANALFSRKSSRQ